MDSQTKLIHSVAATAANVHDSQVLPKLLHGEETRVWGDAAYSGQRDVIRQHAPRAKSFVQTKAHRHRSLSQAERGRNRTKSKVRAKVEHAFLVIKRIFGWAKVGTGGWQRIPTGSRSAAGWQISMCRDGACWRERRGWGAGGGPWGIARWVCLTNRLSEQQRPTEFALGGQSRNSSPS